MKYASIISSTDLNTLCVILQVDPSYKEYSVAVVCISNSLGAVIAGVLSIGMHNIICSMSITW